MFRIDLEGRARNIKRERTLRTATDLVYKNRTGGREIKNERKKQREEISKGGKSSRRKETTIGMLTYEAGPHNSL